MSRARSKARRGAMQALYQWQMAGENASLSDFEFLNESDRGKMDEDYFKRLIHDLMVHLKEIDALIESHVDHSIVSIDPVEKAILRIAVCELAYYLEVPFKVAINEAVELAKSFGADQSHKFVNGLLDQVALELRPDEARGR